MKYKVRIKNAPMQKGREGMQVDYGLDTPLTAMGGANAMNPMSQYATTRSITGVPREEANLEAEGGETVYGDINGDGMPEQNTIKGPRHSEGGVPLNLPEGTFIFSDTKSMRVKDCEILQMFNKPCGKKSYTPADLAKVFDLNAYREILQDPDSDKLDVRTAERMLKNYTVKLGALALAQEAMKGFPQGIPAVAEPYIQAAGINPEEVMPPKEMTSLVENLKKDAQQNQSPEGMPTDPQDIQQAVGMNDGRPVAVPTDAQQPMAQQQMMPPQMQQPQEMLGQPMPGMMPPQEQMMARGGYMELGGYDMPFVMATGGAMQYYDGGAKQKVRITELPKANKGKIIIDEAKNTFDGVKYDNKYEFEKAVYDALQSGKELYHSDGRKLSGEEDRAIVFEQSMDPDGDLAKMYGTEDPANPGTFTMSDEQKLIAANQYYTDQYLNEPSTSKLVAGNIREAIKDANNYKGKTGNVYQSEASVLQEINDYGHTDEDGTPLTFSSIDDVPDKILIQGLTDQNHQAARIKAAGVNTKAFKDSGTEWKEDDDIIAAGITNPDTGELVTDAAGVTALKAAYGNRGISSSGDLRSAYASSKSKVLEQASYLGFMKTANDKKSYAAGSDEAFAARYIVPTELGEGDEPSLYGSASTTPIDGFEGNTDLGQTAVGKFRKFTYSKSPEDSSTKDCVCEDEDGNRVPSGKRDADGNCPPCREVITETIERPEADWWLQDTINTFGAVGDASMIQKQQPWDSPVDLDAPMARYDDPTKELDNNLGRFRQTADTLAQFSGPQGLSSRMSQAAGQAAANAANIGQRYNSRNLALANSAEVRASDTANKERLANRQINKGLYDATMLADDNFNKEKMAARLNRRGLYTTAITNRAKTQALNQMYPDYAVDPASGGFMMHTPNPKNPNPTQSQDVQALIAKYREMGMKDEDAIRAANSIVSSKPGQASSNAAPAEVMAQYPTRNPQSYTRQGKIGGPVGYYVYGGDVYPF